MNDQAASEDFYDPRQVVTDLLLTLNELSLDNLLNYINWEHSNVALVYANGYLTEIIVTGDDKLWMI